MLASRREKKRASSRAKDQVSREAVWWTAFRATRETTKSAAMKIVAATGEWVAFSQTKKMGKLLCVSHGMLLVDCLTDRRAGGQVGWDILEEAHPVGLSREAWMLL